MRAPARLGAAIVAVLLLAAAAPHASTAADPYEIDAVLPVTGGAAFLGNQEVSAIKLFEDTVNKAGGIRGRTIHVTIADDQTNPQVAVQLMTQALDRHPAIVLDGGPATTCRATAALIANGPLQYCFTPSIHPAPGSYQFSAMYSSDDILGVSMRYLRERGLKRIAVLNGTDASGQDADQILQALIKTPEYQNAGVTFVAYEHYNLNDLSVVAQLTRIKAAGAQAFIAFTTGTAIATVLHGMQDLGLDIPCVTSPGNMSYAQMESYKAFMPKELLFAGPPALVPEQLTDPRRQESRGELHGNVQSGRQRTAGPAGRGGVGSDGDPRRRADQTRPRRHARPVAGRDRRHARLGRSARPLQLRRRAAARRIAKLGYHGAVGSG